MMKLLRLTSVLSKGEQIGIVAIDEAQIKAEEADLDLVEIVPNADPPVCRIMDFGKYLFEESKKKHAAKKKQKQTQHPKLLQKEQTRS